MKGTPFCVLDGTGDAGGRFDERWAATEVEWGVGGCCCWMRRCT